MKKTFRIAMLFCLALAMILSTVACKPTSEEPPASEKTYRELYDGIIAQYTALLTAKQNGEELTAPNTEGMSDREVAITEAVFGIVDACENIEDLEKYGYGYQDLDGNGIPELMLLTQYLTVKAIFTISGKTPILLEANCAPNHAIYFTSKNHFLMMTEKIADNIQEFTSYTFHVSGDKLVYDAIYGDVYNADSKELIEMFQMVDGNRVIIDLQTYKELNWEYREMLNGGYRPEMKLHSPRIYLPLAEKVATENLPTVDFSSYATIRETCYKISAFLLDGFKHSDWVKGEYDDLFAFQSDTAFEYYNYLLYIIHYRGNDHLGYDEIDLNGDGQDELVLLDEDYDIRAVFTQKDGVPVLLEELSKGVAWLDDQGLIHVDREEYYELEYSLYDFAKNGDLDLVYAIFLAGNGNRYLTRNGWTKEITFEESLEIHDDYQCYPEYFEANEYTRNVSNLTYTPVWEETSDPLETVVTKTWYNYAELEKTSGKDMAQSSTYMTFENVTEVQMDVNFKYAFTFCYPDPDKENYHLSNTTESFLKVTAHKENGVFVFDEGGVKGRIELGYEHVWLIIEESTDERFIVGHHSCDEKAQTTFE